VAANIRAGLNVDDLGVEKGFGNKSGLALGEDIRDDESMFLAADFPDNCSKSFCWTLEALNHLRIVPVVQ